MREYHPECDQSFSREALGHFYEKDKSDLEIRHAQNDFNDALDILLSKLDPESIRQLLNSRGLTKINAEPILQMVPQNVDLILSSLKADSVNTIDGYEKANGPEDGYNDVDCREGA